MPKSFRHKVILKSEAEIFQMRQAGRIAARALRLVREAIEPGISTAELDDIARAAISDAGAVPTFLGYRDFPAAICTSINSEIVHSIPSKRVKLCRGDIVSLDVGATLNGWIGDTADTVIVAADTQEESDQHSQRLISVTRKALRAGIKNCVAENRLGDVSAAIGAVGRAAGLGIVQHYGGHGIGRTLHEEPTVPNEGTPGKGLLLKVGMTLALEPMFTLGTDRYALRNDGWTVVTQDGSRAAHIEHTVAITEEGPLILTEE
ncbi:MAG: type I methionyl aminopeptidase [Coriobacteriia bacterium]|nr:type I methionyl aminopeptidase [Coriobacteriia bacterium]